MRTYVKMDLAALERNLGKIRSNLPRGIKYISVVKADAYGHGVMPMVTRLMQSNADAFAVANVAEGKQLRAIGEGWPIILLSPVLPDEYDDMVNYDLSPTVSSIDEVKRIDAFLGERSKSLSVHLKIDTGMGRAGVWYEDAASIINYMIDSLENITWQGIYTHFSSADTDLNHTRIQRERFESILTMIPDEIKSDLWIHADNSAGVESFDRDGLYNAVRVGLLQFGMPAISGSLLASINTEPVLSWYAKVALIKELPEGAPISYGQTHTLNRRSKIAVLTVGYADGIPLNGSGRLEVLINGNRCPILGRVTMDQVIVDVTGLQSISIGDEAVLIGRQGDDCISALEFAERCQSIPYAILCGISKRVLRVYQTERPAS